MELLIPGLVLVALMVYASTRIKRSAARAFEAEHVERPDFVIEKPEGFLHKVNTSDKDFEAYSKEYGRGLAENVRAATAVVTRSTAAIDEIADAEKARLSIVESDEKFELDDSHCRLIAGEFIRDGHKFKVREKIIALPEGTLTLRVDVLDEQFNDFVRRIETLISSFAAK